MFKEEELVMVPKPNLNQENIPYLKEFSTDIYVNLFKFNLKKIYKFINIHMMLSLQLVKLI